MKKALLLMLMVLLVVPLTFALTINEPVNNYDYYESLVSCNVTWTSTDNCSYAVNNQQQINLPCDNTFIVDLPFNKQDNVNLTFYENNLSANVIFNVDNDFGTGKAVIVWLLVLIPVVFCILFWSLAFKLDQEHQPVKLFLTGLGLTFLFFVLNQATLAVRSYLHNDTILTSLNTITYIFGWIYWILLVFVLINFLKSVLDWINSMRGNGDN